MATDIPSNLRNAIDKVILLVQFDQKCSCVRCVAMRDLQQAALATVETRAEPDIHEKAVDRLESVFQMVDAIADESRETLKKYGYHPRTGLHQWERDCLNPPAGERACVPVYLSPLMDEDIARGEYQPAPHVAPAAVGSVATVPYAKGTECPAAAGITDSAVKTGCSE